MNLMIPLCSDKKNTNTKINTQNTAILLRVLLFVKKRQSISELQNMYICVCVHVYMCM